MNHPRRPVPRFIPDVRRREPELRGRHGHGLRFMANNCDVMSRSVYGYTASQTQELLDNCPICCAVTPAVESECARENPSFVDAGGFTGCASYEFIDCVYNSVLFGFTESQTQELLDNCPICCAVVEVDEPSESSGTSSCCDTVEVLLSGDILSISPFLSGDYAVVPNVTSGGRPVFQRVLCTTGTNTRTAIGSDYTSRRLGTSYRLESCPVGDVEWYY